MLLLFKKCGVKQTKVQEWMGAEWMLAEYENDWAVWKKHIEMVWL